MIHETAIIDPQAEIAPDVSIGPYAIIDGPVKIGAGSKIHAHAHISGHTTLGRNCEIHPHAVVGNTPQDHSYEGGESYLVVGDDTQIREFVSIHRGAAPGTSTSIGSGCMIMAKAHVAHNCVVGDGVVLTNGVELGGHAQIGKHALIAAHAMVHQFARVGRRSMCVGTALIMRDVPPFCVTDYKGGLVKVNVVGLQREGFSKETTREIKNAFKVLYRSDEPFSIAVEQLKAMDNCPEVEEILEFIANPSKCGIAGRSRSTLE
ncbi:MAG: acyl-ACP--UDP-N-acetylglucosamine O-acyltransferase [Planctomycetota bacterium]|nr:acyl-ACP--UDP-N-acetylglucosamine O-acyltransferase [Planctomycetota bacterium]